jgi:hypothetical protein
MVEGRGSSLRPWPLPGKQHAYGRLYTVSQFNGSSAIRIGDANEGVVKRPRWYHLV